eukprot:TRINITY_DN16349_c0_g1_i1.p1 TRINITY_DN16349_c0_g1~~TRINITY_DN16349_c0_g1_i1.p1  ORF type:complete len:569 (+),score=67.83 TRINITY_DN16349_c0_g1_i1:63-1769(+)
MPYDQYLKAFLLVVIDVVLLVYGACLVIAAWRHGFKSFFSLVRQKFRVKSVSLQTDEVSHEARKLFRKRRLEFARKGIMSFAFFLAAALVVLISPMHMNVGLMASSDFLPNDLYTGHATISTLGLCSAISCFIFEQQPGKKVSLFIYVLTIGRLALTVCLYPSGQDMLLDLPYLLLFQMGAAMAFANSWTALLSSSMLVALSSYVWSSHAAKSIAHGNDVNIICERSDCTQWFVMQQIICSLAMFVLLLLMEQRAYSEAYATVKAQLVGSMRDSVLKLLNMLYDVVLEVDENLTVVSDCEALSSLLLQGPNRSLKGASLADYMFDAHGAAALKDHLQSGKETSTPGFANPISLRLRDGLGSAIPFELLHTSIDRGESQHHLISLREIETASQTEYEGPVVRKKGNAESKRRQVAAGNETPEERVGLASRPTTTGKGTPASRSPLSLEQERDDASDVSLISLLSHNTLIDNRFDETTEADLKAHLNNLLIMCNIKKSQQFCCSYHCLVYKAQKVLKVMRASDCIDTRIYCKRCSFQCPSCMLVQQEPLEVEDGLLCCSFCRHVSSRHHL